MSSGAEHYRRAEELANQVRNMPIAGHSEHAKGILQEAALHAALAQVAATMYGQMRANTNVDQEWANALSGRGPVIGGEAWRPEPPS